MKATHSKILWRGMRLSIACLLPVLSSGCETSPPEQAPVDGAQISVAESTGCDSMMLAEPSALREREYSVPPGIADREGALGAVEDFYPSDLRAAGTGGTAMVHFLIDTTGAVVHSRLARTSGSARLDTAAVAAARRFRFTPAYSGRQRACIWLALPVRFDPST